jgi:hypothetical protein
MSFTTRAIDTMDALRGAATDATAAIDIAEDFCRHVGLDRLNTAFGTSHASVGDFTNEQKAQVFVQVMYQLGKRVLREQAFAASLAAANQTAEAAAATAEAKL